MVKLISFVIYQQKPCNMISDDRRQLNERFIKVFRILEDRGEIVKNDRGGKGMGDFAEKILGNKAYGHIIRAYLNPKENRCIDYSQARKLCEEYGVNISYMFEGIGVPFGFDLSEAPEPEVDRGTKARQGNILATSVEALAGLPLVNDERETMEYFSLPGLSGSGLVAIPVNGNSMEPVIYEGDMIICRLINGLHEIKDNKVYAVKNNGQLWVKYVKTIRNDKGRITHLRLISANYLEHEPFVIEVNEHTRLYLVIRKISEI